MIKLSESKLGNDLNATKDDQEALLNGDVSDDEDPSITSDTVLRPSPGRNQRR